MIEEQERSSNLIDTTDSLESMGVFREWKNFLFVIVLICLILLQTSFWLVNTCLVKTGQELEVEKLAIAAVEKAQSQSQAIEKAAQKAVVDTGQPAKAVADKPKPKKFTLPFTITFQQISLLITFLNFIAILSATLYCLTLLFALKVSMLGRLGGINHICRAFFISLVFVVLLLPWQRLFAGIVVGSIFTPAELSSSHSVLDRLDIVEETLYYVRFTGYWAIEVLLLICAQVRSIKWSKATLRRLEII